MEAELSLPRLRRARRRHELRSLTYVTLGESNGGVIRNLNRDGIGVQAAGAVNSGQRLQARFELAHPRLRVDAWGEVAWANSDGKCGIRFLDLSSRMAGRIDEWIFENLLESVSRPSPQSAILPFSKPLTDGAENDGLIVSPAPSKVIELPARSEPPAPLHRHGDAEAGSVAASELDWLSQPLSSRGIAWAVNTLAVFAALLLFVLVFLSVTREAPKWPFAMAAGAVIFVAAAYWGFFKLFGGISPGARLARLAGYDVEEEHEAARFR
jgi:hypothetical protein